MAPGNLCYRCGTSISPSDRFCRSCGAPLSTAGQPYVVPPGWTGAPAPPMTSTPPPEFGIAPPQGIPGGFPGPTTPTWSSMPASFSPNTAGRQYDRPFDAVDLAHRIRSLLNRSDLELTESGEPEDLFVQIRRRGPGRFGDRFGDFIGGGNTVICVRIQPMGATTLVSVGQINKTKRTELREPAGGATLNWITSIPGSDWRQPVVGHIWQIVDAYAQSLREGARSDWAGGPPRQAVQPRMFGGRDEERRRIESSLQGALRARPEHLLLIGPPGIGKSSLLRKTEEMAHGLGCLGIRREVPSSTDSVMAFSDFMIRTTQDALRHYLPPGQAALDAVSSFWIEHELSVPFPGWGAISVRRRARYDAFDPEHTVSYLEKLWHQAERQGIRGFVFLFDDADGLSRVPGGWAFLRGISNRIAEHGVRHLIVAAVRSQEALDGPASGSVPDRFFSPIPLHLMTPEETASTFNLVLTTSNLSAMPSTVERVHVLTGGHPYGVHTLSFHAARAAIEHGTGDVTPQIIEEIIPKALRELGDQIYRPLLESLTPEERAAIQSIANTKRTTTRRAGSVKSRTRKPSAQKLVLENLVQRGILVRTAENSYAIRGELIQRYVQSRSLPAQ
jgi:AAA ATPase domain